MTNLHNTLEGEDEDDAEELNEGNRDSRVSEHLLKELVRGPSGAAAAQSAVL